MTSQPYEGLPDHAFWRRAVAQMPWGQVNPVLAPGFCPSPESRIATGGSCFAQHIGPALARHGHAFFVTEPAHPIASPELAMSYHYGLFSARYGNIYTARQLLQLFQRAYGWLQPLDDMWRADDGTLIDPFRPQIQPGGFLTVQEYHLDRAQHFAAVRRLFEQLDVFIFTLGLTEAWRARADGAVYPLCPGTAAGVFDAAAHEFHNFTVAEVEADLLEFADCLRAVNPRARLVLTVSPVPLVATARADTHVLTATTYSKSVLLVAAATAAARRPGIDYFPAYEIIMGPYEEGTYFAPDKRSVTVAGVGHVMRVFFGGAEALVAPASMADTHFEEMAARMGVLCDEIALDPEGRL
jgi:hypothetical protein